MTMPRLASMSVLFVSFLSGCATQYVIPDVSRPQSSGIGIEVSLGAFVTLRQVYFARIDDEDGLLQRGVYISNYINDDRAYFLNARPGTYVAVGVFHLPGQRGAPYTTYFSKELVELTKVTVRENEFVFMGSYVVNTSSGLDGADGLQAHYRSVITALNTPFRDSQNRGTLGEQRNDEMSRNEFLLRAKEDFSGSAWAQRIK
jgi:hypothetical protein